MSVGERHLHFCFYCIFFVLYYIYRKQSIFFKYYRRILIYFLWIFIENNLFSSPVDSWVAVMVIHFSLFLLLPPALVAKKPQKQNLKKKKKKFLQTNLPVAWMAFSIETLCGQKPTVCVLLCILNERDRRKWTEKELKG